MKTIILNSLKYVILILGSIMFLSSCTLSANLTSLNPSASDSQPVNPGSDEGSANNKIGTMIAIPQDSANVTLDDLFVDKMINSGEKVSSVVVISQPSNGVLSGQGINYYYTPNPGFFGEDAISYEALSEKGNKATGSIKFKIARNHTWYGAGSDAKWTNPTNWIGGVPTNADIAYFDDSCIKCEVIVDGISEVSGVLIDTNFEGVINLSNDDLIVSQIVVGNSGFILKKGTINLGKGKISVASDVSLEAGTLNGNSGSFVASKNFTIMNTVIFNAQNSLLEFNGSSGGSISVGTAELNKVSFTHDSSAKTITGDLKVRNKLYFNVSNDSVNSGNLVAYGDIEVAKLSSCCGSAKIIIAGSSNQLVSGTNIGFFPNLEIASTGGVVTFKDTIRIRKNFTFISGSLQFNDPAFGPSTVDFTGSSVGGTISVPDTLQFANVSFTHDSSSKTLVGTLSVYGSLLFNVTFVSITGGQIDAYGDVNLTKMASSGSAMNLRLVGNNNQLVTGTVNGVVPNFEVVKTGGTAFVAGVLSVSKNFKYTSGVIDFYNSGFGTASTVFTGANTGGTITVPNSLLFGNVSFTHDSTSKTISGVMSVGGDLLFNVSFVSLLGGQIDAYGNVTVTKMSASGTTVLSLKGTLDQLVSSTVNGNIPHLEINKPSGIAIFSGSLGVVRNITYVTGGTEFDSVTYGRSTVRFVGANTGGTINTGSMLLGDVIFSHDSTSKSLTGTLYMKGNLTVNTTFVWVNGGMIDVQGNVVITKTGGSPAAVAATQLTLSGNQNQNISQTAAIVFPGKTLTINKTGGNVELLTAVSLSTTQHLTYTSTNSLNMNGLVLNGNGTFTCNSGTINRGGALIWASGTTNNIGCTIN